MLDAGENGVGKRTLFDDENGPVYRIQSRGGKGVITMKTGDKTGDVVGALTVRDADEIMLITTKGQMVRTRVKEIRRDEPQHTMGVILIPSPRRREAAIHRPLSSATRTTKNKNRHPPKPSLRNRGVT